MVGQLSVQLLTFVTGLMVLRWLDEPEYAKAGLVLGFQSTLAVFVDLGIGGSLVALIGSRGSKPDVVGGYVAAARWWRNLLLAVILPLGAIAFQQFSSRQGWSAPESFALFACIGVQLFGAGLSAIASAPLLIHQRVNVLYAVSNAGAVARLMGCWLLHSNGHLDAVSVTVLGTAISLCSGLCHQWATRPLVREPARTDALVRREIRRYVAPLVPMTAYFAVQGQLAVFLIAWFGQSQGIAEVTALGRLGQLFNFLSALFGTLIIPRLAGLPDQAFLKRYPLAVGGVLAISGLIAAVGFAVPQPLLWLLGHNYAHLSREVSWSVLAGALGFAAGTIWCIHAARKWVFWAGTWFYIGSITLVQLIFVARVDMTISLNVVLMGVAVNAAALLNQAVVSTLGLGRRLSPDQSAPVRPPIICVNSTLAAQTGFVAGGAISPIHLWGLKLQPDDALLGHSFTRFEIVLRSRIRGLDLRLLYSVLIELLRGKRRIYLVSVPDLQMALPLIRWMCPPVYIVTWAWISQDIKRNLRQLRACDHVFCLTEGALDAMVEVGLGSRASLQLWGSDPSYYASEPFLEHQFDVCLLGQTLRDFPCAIAAVAQGRFTVSTSARVVCALQSVQMSSDSFKDLTVLPSETHADVVAIFHRARVSWIPLLPGDEQPTGYTNLAESLLCGTPVVIADSSNIPSQVLSLPGVYRYRTGDANDLVTKTHEALAASRLPGRTKAVQVAAAALLNGQALTDSLDLLLR
jgi:hypothetical protein